MFSILLHFLFNENQQCVPGLGWCLHPSQYIIYYIHYIHHIYFYHYIIYILYFICIIYCIPGLGKCLRLSQYIIYYLHYIHHIYLSLYNIYINLFVLWTFKGRTSGKKHPVYCIPGLGKCLHPLRSIHRRAVPRSQTLHGSSWKG